MEGYSVTEAASVLGVPTERVWELLARGVLSGAPEGETGMRVYLQPRPAPAPVEEKRHNGNDVREPERELSPFRELLTEFRNLTERYGQALLALGEARGEVAALRSRVDLLEARMDLRLPAPAAPMASPAWGQPAMPMPPERMVLPAEAERPREPGSDAAAEAPGVPEPESAAPEAVGPEAVGPEAVGPEAVGPEAVEAEAGQPEAPPEVPAERTSAVETADEEEARRVRLRGPRRAIESFAEALARAEDPSVPELPGAADAAGAAVASRDHAIPEPEPILPREVAAAEAVPVAEERTEPAPAVVGDPGAAVAAEDAEEADAVEVQPDPVEVTGRADTVDEPAGTAAPSEQLDEAPAGPAAEPLAWDAERYTTSIEEPDWLEAEVVEPPMPTGPPAAAEPSGAAEEPVEAPRTMEQALTAEEGEAPMPPYEASTVQQVAEEAESQPHAAVSAAPDVSHPAPEPALPSVPESRNEQVEATAPDAEAPGEETVVSYGASEEAAGASEMEVAPAGGRPATERGPRQLPGTRDLDVALAELEALRRRTSPPPRAEAESDDEWPPARQSEAAPSARLGAPHPTSGPATRAYRRLRRIFPG